MHHPIFEKFDVLSSSEVAPEFHYGFLGEVRRTSFEDMLTTALGLEPIVYAAGQIRRGDCPKLGEEYFEWIDVLETVVAATEFFTMIELGAGYGRWLVRAALAVKRYHGNLPIKLI